MAQTSNNNKILSNKFVQEYLTTVAGEDAVRIIRAANSEMTDDALAAKCKLKVSEIRSVLNKLHDLRLAKYVRMRDKDTGWYSYIWKVELSDIPEIYNQNIEEEIEKLENQLEEATTVFSFYCPKCSKENRIDFDTASNLDFRCPNCRKQLKEVKSDQPSILEMIKELKKKQSQFKESLQNSSKGKNNKKK